MLSEALLSVHQRYAVLCKVLFHRHRGDSHLAAAVAGRSAAGEISTTAIFVRRVAGAPRVGYTGTHGPMYGEGSTAVLASGNEHEYSL